MKALSEEARALVERLVPKARFAFLRRGDGVEEIASRLAELGERPAIPFLAPLIATRDEEAVGRALDVLLRDATIDELMEIEQRVRSYRMTESPHFPRWRALDAGDVPHSAAWGRSGITALLTFHPNGFVREEAVKRLAELRDGSEVPFLLLRLNDWVPQVRRVAKAAVLARMRPDSVGTFTKHFGFFTRLERYARADHKDVLAAFVEVYRGDVEQNALQVLRRHLGSARRAALRFLMRGAQWPPRVVAAASTCDDPVIRSWSIEAASSLAADARRRLLEILMTDRATAVRRVALASWVASYPEDAEPKLLDALLGRGASIRELARFALRNRDMSPAGFYRDALVAASSTKRVEAAISGLAETGARDDAQLIAPYLADESSAVRRAAAKAMMRLDPAGSAEQVFALVGDPVRSVSSRARHALQPHAASLGAEAMRRLYEGSSIPHVRRNALLLMTALSKWESVVTVLEAVRAGDANAELARQFFRRWSAAYNRSYSTPTTAQRERVLARLGDVRELAGDAFADELRFTLGG